MPSRRAVLAGFATTLAAPALALPEPAAPRLRRQYLDGPFGQLHLRVAEPVGRPSAPPLLLMHQSPLSGRMFDHLLPLLARDRLAIAVDTPGYGESDRPPTRPSLAGYGDAILDPVIAAFGSSFDLLGYHTGAVIAADLAARRAANVRRLVLISMPYFTTARRQALLAQLEEASSPYADDGSHLLPLWTQGFRVKPGGQSLDDLSRLVAEKQRVGRFGSWALAAAMANDAAPTLRAIRRPTLILAPHDGLQEPCRSAARLIQQARLVELAALAYGLFDAAPAAIADSVLAFL